MFRRARELQMKLTVVLLVRNDQAQLLEPVSEAT